jgi:regulator of protease activity HflC (stomatin/prohibitin superfamily)
MECGFMVSVGRAMQKWPNLSNTAPSVNLGQVQRCSRSDKTIVNVDSTCGASWTPHGVFVYHLHLCLALARARRFLRAQLEEVVGVHVEASQIPTVLLCVP